MGLVDVNNPFMRKLTHRRKKYIVLLFIISFIALVTIFLNLKKKSALQKQTKKKKMAYRIPTESAIVKYIIRESDNALKYETRSKQNDYFNSLKSVFNLQPVKMTLQTTVFLYKRDLSFMDISSETDDYLVDNTSKMKKMAVYECFEEGFLKDLDSNYMESEDEDSENLGHISKKYKTKIHDLRIKKDIRLKKEFDSLKYLIIKRAIIRPETNTQEDVISMSLDHPNLLKTYKTFRLKHVKRNNKQNSESDEIINQEIVFLYSEFLRHRISNKYVNMDENIIRIILKDVLEGLSHMHSLNIAHLDIKIANIMGSNSKEQEDSISSRKHDDGVQETSSSTRNTEFLHKKEKIFKLIDFGYARDLSKTSDGRKFKEMHIPSKSYGTFPYKPPEVVLENIHGLSSDIWCIGAVAWFLSLGKVPFYHEDGDKNTSEYRKFLKGSKKHFFYPDTSAELKDFVLICMNIIRTLRPSAKKLLKHPFITGEKFAEDSGYESNDSEHHM